MKRNIIQEIKVQKREHHFIPEEPAEVLHSHISSSPHYKAKKKNLSKTILWLGILALLGGIVFWSGMLLASAKVDIVSKTREINLNKETFTAVKNPSSLLGFEIMIVTDELKKDLVFTDTKDVSLFAKGDITLFNEFNTKPQVIPIHTKLSDNNGLIYLTDKAVSIPGYTLSTDKKVIPGSISLSVTAQKSGDTYNGDPRDFSIVVFKNTTKNKKIYARSTTPLSGGALGTVYLLGPEQIGELNAEANSTFRVAMMKKLGAQVPPGYILYPNAVTFSFNVPDTSISPTPEGLASIKGTLSAIIFKNDNLPETIIKQVFTDIPQNELSEIEIPKLNSFDFNFSDPAQTITKDMKEVTFTLTGSDTIIWHPNVDLLKSNISGINKKDAQTVFDRDPGIASVHLSLLPPWLSYLPSDPAKIKINIK